MIDLNHYVGLPWRDRGRMRNGCDCWGLLRLVYAGELGIGLPDHSNGYADTSDRPAVAGLIEAGLADWMPVAAGRERPLDAILIRQAPWHVGIVVRRGLMLHMPENQSSCIEPYDTGRWSRRVEGIYRHRSAAP
ncbi:cell wall-associated NlpC family hydrolase [Aquamicrobium lusatiense]|uniref:Cell wall-associated NlpC family hydrolase n=1 Tax=Aquamicrobium lusatiense TaxID=89772 RepID=A0A7W9VTK2_9HYPH|nr:NlpC/P60 family protein [Aquamicrobium lusatiense]MBB6011869.1 cell wall-associated NlpC family hydrolase [Aquamicrobium lusatiense]